MKTILITDKNPHIRELLSRELKKAKYRTHIIVTPDQILKKICGIEKTDLIVLDPEIVNEKFFLFLNRLLERASETTIVVHAYAEWRESFQNYAYIYFIEKNGTSISHVKKIITTLVPV